MSPSLLAARSPAAPPQPQLHPPTVFVVDDDPVARCLLQGLIERSGMRAELYPSAEAFLDAFDPDRGGCLLLDLRMPGMSGEELQQRLAERRVELPVIIVTGHGAIDTAVRAMKLRAIDFLQKPLDPQVLLERIHEAVARDEAGRRSRAVRDEAQARVARLTRREREVMDLVVAGRANKQIAAELGVSAKTVEVHRAQVMRKIEAQSLAELVRVALTARAGLPAD